MVLFSHRRAAAFSLAALLALGATACGPRRSDAARSADTTSAAEGASSTTAEPTPSTTAAPSAPTTAVPPGGYASAISTVTVSDPRLDPFERQITSLMTKAGLPGASLLVVQHGKLVEHEAWMAYDLDTFVPIASGSKWLSAATIMSVVDEGKLSLDAPLSTYLPETARLKVGAITVRQLLSFTSGLIDGDRVACLQGPTDRTLQQCAAEILSAGAVLAPGEVFRYGSQHLQVAAALAEKVTGTPFAELFQQRIAIPLGMTRTGFVQIGGTEFRDVTNPLAAGSAVSTLGDYGRFLEMIVHDGVAPSGARILRAETVAEMQRNQIAGARYGNAAPFRVQLRSPYGLGEWLDWTDRSGAAMVLSSDGAFGFRPWIDKQNDLFGVYLINDQGNGYVEGDPNAAAADGGKVHTSGNWVFQEVAVALGTALPKINYP